MNEKNNKYWIWFSRIEGLTCIQKEMLLKKYQSPQKIWSLNRNDLTQLQTLNEENIKAILNKKYRLNLEKYQEYMQKNNIKTITIFDREYPKRLRNIYDKPVILFAKGNLELFNKKTIAMVGCRKCSTYGKNIAKKLAYDFASNNVCIVSGLAVGIDKYSHIGALEAGGSTIAVIGNGLDNIYPYENKDLADRILKNNNLIISEYIIGTKPNKINFPARNRIISGLSDGVVVVEAREKSGSLITADFALEQGKDVFAVPGNIDTANSEGTNNLIKMGAYLITGYEDVKWTKINFGTGFEIKWNKYQKSLLFLSIL